MKRWGRGSRDVRSWVSRFFPEGSGSYRTPFPRPGGSAGLCFECTEIDDLAADLKAKGFPVGEPHPALQGGRIVSVNQSGACGVPVAFIDFTGSPGPPSR